MSVKPNKIISKKQEYIGKLRPASELFINNFSLIVSEIADSSPALSLARRSRILLIAA